MTALNLDALDLSALLCSRVCHDVISPVGAIVNGLEVLEGMAPDAIISDINMPRLDGFGFIRAVRAIERMRGVPILVLTTESAPELKARAREAGATGWIVKPFDPGKLVKTVQMVTG